MAGDFLKNNKRGFTLIEMMVAIAVFSIVMVTAMSALMNVIDANNKAKAIKTAVNNVTLALEGISKDMRMGTKYSCDGAGDCPDGNTKISFKSSKTGNPFTYYEFKKNSKGIGQLFSCVSDESDTDGTNCDGTYYPLTSGEVDLTNVTFYVIGVEDSTNPIGTKTQPRVIITISGKAGSKTKIETVFDLQTSISQVTRPGTIQN